MTLKRRIDKLEAKHSQLGDGPPEMRITIVNGDGSKQGEYRLGGGCLEPVSGEEHTAPA